MKIVTHKPTPLKVGLTPEEAWRRFDTAGSEPHKGAYISRQPSGPVHVSFILQNVMAEVEARAERHVAEAV